MRLIKSHQLQNESNTRTLSHLQSDFNTAKSRYTNNAIVNSLQLVHFHNIQSRIWTNQLHTMNITLNIAHLMVSNEQNHKLVILYIGYTCLQFYDTRENMFS